MSLLEDRPAVKIVDLLAAITPIDLQATFLRAPERMRIRYCRTTAWTA
jgi:hypothetical protein